MINIEVPSNCKNWTIGKNSNGYFVYRKHHEHPILGFADHYLTVDGRINSTSINCFFATADEAIIAMNNAAEKVI